MNGFGSLRSCPTCQAVDLAPPFVAPLHHRHELLGDVVHWQQTSRGGDAEEGDGLFLAAVVELFAVGGGGDGGGEVDGGDVLEGTGGKVQAGQFAFARGGESGDGAERLGGETVFVA